MKTANNTPALNPTRLWERVDALAQYTVAGQPWTRRAFSDLFLQARAWLTTQFEAAGLTVHLDAAGNLVGRREGRNPNAKPIVTGSHCDTVLSGGRFDGIIGVLAGIEVAHALHEQGVILDHPFEVIDFLSEEPSDYGISCVGSRAIAGLLDETMLNARDQTGETLAAGIARVGGNPPALSMPLRPTGSTAAFVELHIEQGPVLETKGLPIGIVTNIVGIRRYKVMIDGQPDHAGTTPMNIRRDALVGAARVIEVVNGHARSMLDGPDYVVATIGHLVLTPNASNAVPGHVEMMLEVRSDSPAVLRTFADDVMSGVRDRVESLGLQLVCTQVSDSLPTHCTPFMVDLIEQAATNLGYACLRMPSGAGHDAVYLAKTGPMGMIFIPCLKGRSHCPEEWIEPRQLLDGTRVLYETVMALDRSLPVN
ncbi:Zn-dependent hydrolase [Pollutimonas nitritireducens]|uniref:Zn-dependent hydrolase n=1 Tax=Pollutimonas nitritireducens TaxID=2045209 RepID=A0A2N4UBS5_9BURK|nr:Zn-dependent hydrolase [Pollutimonas nitritireducens]PLC52474.1 Zn-dependent hydrolase [Pollutimonas nitritireducens]